MLSYPQSLPRQPRQIVRNLASLLFHAENLPQPCHHPQIRISQQAEAPQIKTMTITNIGSAVCKKFPNWVKTGPPAPKEYRSQRMDGLLSSQQIKSLQLEPPSFRETSKKRGLVEIILECSKQDSTIGLRTPTFAEFRSPVSPMNGLNFKAQDFKQNNIR